MRLNKLGFGALLSYSPYGHSKEEELSRSFRTAIKNDEFVRISGKQVQMSEFIAESIQKSKDSLPFAHLFDNKTILVPARSSSLMKANSLWVPFRIATAMQKGGWAEKSRHVLFANIPYRRQPQAQALIDRQWPNNMILRKSKNSSQSQSPFYW